MSAKHHSKDIWLVDDNIVSPTYVRSFANIYDRVRLSPYIKWHHHNHPCKYAPTWKTLEFMTIGEILDLYDVIADLPGHLHAPDSPVGGLSCNLASTLAFRAIKHYLCHIDAYLL